eukprot:15415357-Heterocapsa_arctica.AAC.1
MHRARAIRTRRTVEKATHKKVIDNELVVFTVGQTPDGGHNATEALQGCRLGGGSVVSITSVATATAVAT